MGFISEGILPDGYFSGNDARKHNISTVIAET